MHSDLPSDPTSVKLQPATLDASPAASSILTSYIAKNSMHHTKSARLAPFNTSQSDFVFQVILWRFKIAISQCYGTSTRHL